MPQPAYSDITAWVRRHRRLVLFTHRRADGDALGSLLAFAEGARRVGAQPKLYLFEPLPKRFAFWSDVAEWNVWSEAAARDLVSADGVVILDTCSFGQLEPITLLLPDAPPTLVIDHHETVDGIGVRTADMRLVDPRAGATCLLLAEWLVSEGVELDPPLARALFAGIATDSGWFRFSNADERMLQMAARLVGIGARPAELYMLVQQQEPAGKLRLAGRALARMQLHVDERLAVMQLRTDDFNAAGADRSMTEELVNEPLRIGSVIASLLFVEEADGMIRANLRSKHTLDVAALAREFGGGGHARAAGTRLRGAWDEATGGLIARAEQLLTSAASQA